MEQQRYETIKNWTFITEKQVEIKEGEHSKFNNQITHKWLYQEKKRCIYQAIRSYKVVFNGVATSDLLSLGERTYKANLGRL